MGAEETKLITKKGWGELENLHSEDTIKVTVGPGVMQNTDRLGYKLTEWHAKEELGSNNYT